MVNKIAIVGSRKYTNKIRIKEFIFKLKEKFGDDITIVSGGCKDGADRYAKKYALEFDMNYVEFPPRHHPYNQHCVLDRGDYGKKYAVWNYFERNKKIVEYSDKVVAFIPSGVTSKGTMNTIEHANTFEKKVIIFD